MYKIEAKELRIGNILDFQGMLCEVKEIDEQGAVVHIEETGETEWIDLFQFSPVPLSKDILIEHGFKVFEFKSKITGTHLLEFHIPDCDIDIIYFDKNNPEHGFYYGTWENSKQLEYLHQLQNILNFLTDK